MGIKQSVLEANKWIVDKGLVELTWGNVSVKDINIVIKPSGIALDQAVPDDMSEVNPDCQHLSGKKPSVDTPSHVELYKNFPGIKSVIHTHSKYATIFAQANRAIPCLGTTHADYFYGDVPCVPHPSAEGVKNSYEANTGRIIGEYFTHNELNYLHTPACLVQGHGVFVWGTSVNHALETAYVLEIVAEMAYKTLLLDSHSRLADFVVQKHFTRKHGDTKYYGQ